MHVATIRPESIERRRWWILGVLSFSVLVLVLDNSVLNVALPAIVRELHASNSQLQWVVDAYSLAFAGLLLTMGSLGDKYGRRPALQIGFLVFGAGSAISALVGSADQLIASRALMGVGAALIMPATLSIITNVFPAGERPKAIAIWTATVGVGVALGPLTGGFLLQHFYWGSIFLVNIPIVVVGLLAGEFLIPDSHDPNAKRLDGIGAVLSIIGLSSLLYAVIEAPTHGWTDGQILAAFAIGGIVLALFFAWEAHVDHPMLDLHFWANPRFSGASGAIAVTFLALFGSVFLLTQYLQFVLGLSALETGVRLLATAIPIMVIAPLAPPIVRRIGTKLTVAIGLATVAGSLLSFGSVDVTTGFGGIAWRLALLGVGMGLTMAPATESIMGAVPLAAGRRRVGRQRHDPRARGRRGRSGHRQRLLVGVRVEGRRRVARAPGRARLRREGLGRSRARDRGQASRLRRPGVRGGRRSIPSSRASTPGCWSPRSRPPPASSPCSHSSPPARVRPTWNVKARSSRPNGARLP